MSGRRGGGGGGSGGSSGGGRATFSFSNVYIDALNGNDGNSGLATNQAWKTNARFASAVGVYGLITAPGTGARYATVHYINRIPTDFLNLQAVVDTNVTLRFLGTALVTTVHSSTLTAAVDYSNSNTLGSVSDTTVTWSAYVGMRITMTAGASVGAHAWIAKDLGSNQARTSKFALPLNLVTPADTRAPTLKAPTTDTYTIDSLPSLAVGLMDVQGIYQGGSIYPNVMFQDLDLSANANDAYPNPTGTSQYLIDSCSCEWNQLYFNATFYFSTTFFAGGLQQQQGRVTCYACYFTGAGGADCSAAKAAYLILDGYTLIDTCGVMASYGGIIQLGWVVSENAAAYSRNPDGDGFCSYGVASGSSVTHGGGIIFAMYSSYGTPQVLGTGNAGVGWRVGEGCTHRFTTVPLVTGTGGDFALGAVTSAYGVTAGGPTAATIACSWANTAVNTGGGGFGGSAHWPRSNTHMIAPDVN